MFIFYFETTLLSNILVKSVTTQSSLNYICDLLLFMNKFCDPSFFVTPIRKKNDGPLEVLTVETYIGLHINSIKHAAVE